MQHPIRCLASLALVKASVLGHKVSFVPLYVHHVIRQRVLMLVQALLAVLALVRILPVLPHLLHHVML